MTLILSPAAIEYIEINNNLFHYHHAWSTLPIFLLFGFCLTIYLSFNKEIERQSLQVCTKMVIIGTLNIYIFFWYKSISNESCVWMWISSTSIYILNFLRFINFSGQMGEILLIMALGYTICFIIGTLAFFGQILDETFLSSLINLFTLEMKAALSLAFLILSSDIINMIKSVLYDEFIYWNLRQDKGMKYLERSLIFPWLFAITIFNIYWIWEMGQLFIELFEGKNWIMKEGFYLELAMTLDIWVSYPEVAEKYDANQWLGIYAFMRFFALFIHSDLF